MANQKEIRVKISSTKKTMKITSAMKLVAAAKVNKMQKILVQSRPYAQKITTLFQNLQATLSEDDIQSNPLLCKPNSENTVLLVTVASDRGLCGAYNANIIKATNKRIKELKEEGKTIKLLTIGRKAKTAFSKESYSLEGIEIIESFMNLSSIPDVEEASLIAQKAVELYTSGTVDKVEVITTRFISLVANEVEIHDFLPITANADENDSANTDVLLEPDAQTLVETLAPMYINNFIFKSLQEATTSELAARMTAMSNATKNAKDFIKKLVLEYNKARQASITQEISEIVGGAAALA